MTAVHRSTRGSDSVEFLAERRTFLGLAYYVSGYVKLQHAAGSDALLAKTGGDVVVGLGEAGAVVELPLVLEAVPADLGHLLTAHGLAIEVGVELGDVDEGRLEELAEAGGVADGVH